MSVTAITVQQLKAASNKTAPGAGSLVITLAAADAVNGNKFIATGKEIILAQNTDSSTHHITITSAPDALGRTADIASYAVAGSAFVAFDLNQLPGWQQGDGTVLLSADNALIFFAVLRHS